MPVTRDSLKIEEVPQNKTRSELSQANVGNLRNPRALTSNMRQNLRQIIIDPAYAALTAHAVNSHQQRLVKIDIRGWLDHHRIYGNAVRFEQWGRLTPRRVTQPAMLAIEYPINNQQRP